MNMYTSEGKDCLSTRHKFIRIYRQIVLEVVDSFPQIGILTVQYVPTFRMIGEFRLPLIPKARV